MVSAPNGTTEDAANAAVAEITGASVKRIASAAEGPQLLLEHQLDDVGERLKKTSGADAVRTEPLL